MVWRPAQRWAAGVRVADSARSPRSPDPPRKARLTVVAGPSGVGKGAVIAEVRRRYPQVWLSVSATTRAPRPGEVDGEQYLFLDEDRFRQLAASGGFLEYAEYAGNLYGTPRIPVEERIAAGQATLLELDIQGARQIRAAMPDALLVFLTPPSWAELVRRLTGRSTEDAATVDRRLDQARVELAAEPEFDDVVVNDVVTSAADRLVSLMGLPT